MEHLPFANGHAWLLSETNELAKHVRAQMCRMWGTDPTTDRFPGPQPVSIERKHIPLLKSQRYLVTEKTDGERFLLVVTDLEMDDNSYAVLVNRKNQVYLIDAAVQATVCKGTILDGELIRTKQNRYEFLVFDCVYAFGESCMHSAFETRVQKAAEVVSNITDCRLMNIQIKEFVKLTELERYLTHVMPKLTHEVDGLIFTPCALPVGTGTNYSMFKWKPRYKNTVDFLLHHRQHEKKTDGSWVYNAKIMKKPKNSSKSYPTILRRVHVYVDSALHEIIQSTTNDVIMECENIALSPEESWKGLFVRGDKTYPNSMLTYSKTKLNIQENIEPHEFYHSQG